MINSKYTIKQYIILMYVHTYRLNNEWYRIGSHHNMIVVDKREKKINYWKFMLILTNWRAKTRCRMSSLYDRSRRKREKHWLITNTQLNNI